MADSITIRINNEPATVAPGTTVAAAILGTGRWRLRQSVRGEPRGPVCGMGICGECRVTINGRRHERSCQTPCQEGMEVRTDG